MPKRAGYSLTELMITVAIVGVLAAIAVPAWRESQLRAKRAEVPPNVEGIRVAELAYFAAMDTFVAETSWYPNELTGSTADMPPRAWPSPEAAGGFTSLGWMPFNSLRGAYSIPDGDEDSFEVQGLSNVDGDGEYALYWCTESVPGDWDAGDFSVF